MAHTSTDPLSDLSLPGQESRGYESCLIASAIAQSGRFNIRGAEAPLYGFINIILNNLIADLRPTALVMPQLQLDILQIEIPAGSQVKPTDSFASYAQKPLEKLIPDFVVPIVKAVDRKTRAKVDWLTSPKPVWSDIRITHMVVGLLVEVKRSPTRSANTAINFSFSLKKQLDVAQDNLLHQAKLAFSTFEGSERIIMVAMSGEWWAWRWSKRPDVSGYQPRIQVRQILRQPRRPNAQLRDVVDGDPQEPNRNSVALDGRPAKKDAKEKISTIAQEELKAPDDDGAQPDVAYKPGKPGSADTEKTSKPAAPQKAHFTRYLPKHLEEIYGNSAKEGVELMEDFYPQTLLDRNGRAQFETLFTDTWSGVMLNGTDVSNQHWKLIHDWLARLNTKVDAMDIPGEWEADVSDHEDSALDLNDA
ncbi:hypothetical protein H0H92_007519 [Tricholoma furcatifolium]|nr:hypothetical protein H0H92_007519 [Tricholoma furcatifolium]